jgi:hypothetical protein
MTPQGNHTVFFSLSLFFTGTARMSPGHHRDITGTLPGHCRDTPGTLTGQYCRIKAHGQLF